MSQGGKEKGERDAGLLLRGGRLVPGPLRTPLPAPAPATKGEGPIVTAILAAAGVGERLGRARAFIELAGHPLIWHSLRVLEQSLQVDAVILVVAPEEEAAAREFIAGETFTKVRDVVAGGRDRGASIWSGLRRADPRTRIVLIHDGARPLVTPELVLKAILRCISTGSAVLAIPVRDSVRRVVREFVTEAVDRKQLHLIQTPQAFRYGTIYEAYRRGVERVSWPGDDAALVEELGEAVNLVEGSVENIKIATPEDLELAEAILRCRTRRGAGPEGRS